MSWGQRSTLGLQQVKEKQNWQESRERDYPRLLKGTKGCGFPKRWRPVPFSPVVPLQDGYAWEGDSLSTQRSGVQGTPRTSKTPAPSSATRHPATEDRGGSDSSPGNWNKLEAREAFPECSVCMKPFLWSCCKAADNPRDDWELTSHR